MGGFVSSGIGSNGSSVNRQTSAYSPLKQIISLLEDLDQKRQVVEKKEQELENARQDMVSATKNVQAKFENLDPSTRNLIKGILGQIDEKTNYNLIQEEKTK